MVNQNPQNKQLRVALHLSLSLRKRVTFQLLRIVLQRQDMDHGVTRITRGIAKGLSTLQLITVNGLERTHNLLLRRWAPYTCDYTIEIYMQYYNPYICISNPDKHIQRFVIMIGLDPTIPRSPAPGKRILLVRPNDHNNHGSVESCGKNLVIPRNFTSNDYGGTQTHNLLLRR